MSGDHADRFEVGSAAFGHLLAVEPGQLRVGAPSVVGGTDHARAAQLPVKSGDREITEAVSKITLTASAEAAVAVGQFQEFDVSAGPLPKIDQLVFKALQTYSDGDIVRWIEVPKAGDSPEHPAPVLKLAAAAAAVPSATAAIAQPADDTAGGNSWGVGLGAAGLLAGLAGLVMGLMAYRRNTVTAGGAAYAAQGRGTRRA